MASYLPYQSHLQKANAFIGTHQITPRPETSPVQMMGRVRASRPFKLGGTSDHLYILRVEKNILAHVYIIMVILTLE